MVDALKRASAKRITVVTPFYGYARQDKKHRGREPISARLMADLFKTAGADRLMAVDLHTVADPGVLRRSRSTTCSRSSRWRTTWAAGRPQPAHRRRRPTPDACAWPSGGPTGSAAPLAIIHKRRDPGVPNEVKVHEVVGEVEGRTCVIVDDMIDTGGTIVKAAEALFDSGAAEVIVAATHGIFSGPAVDRLKNSRVSEVVVHQHAADPAGEAVRQADGAVDRPAASPARSARSSTTARSPPVRRQRLSCPPARVLAARRCPARLSYVSARAC